MTVQIHDVANGYTGEPNIEFKDGPALDAFSRQRVSQPFGIFDFKAITGRGETVWEERLTGAVIVHGTVTGTFTAGDTFSGGTSGKKGTITAVGAGNITYSTSNNDFVDGETITILTGGVPGSTAVITSHDTGADIVYNYDRSSINLKVGNVSGQRVVRQTIRYFTYNPGYSQLIMTTQVLSPTKTGLKQTVMYGDDLNGLGICLEDATVKVFKRSSVTGSAVTTYVSQADWLDRMDGTGGDRNASGIKLDIVKSQIQAIDFQWLGSGRVRFCLNIRGVLIPIYEFEHANDLDVVYMKTPSLPIRYEIENTGTTSSASTLEQICCSVASEGGYLLPGYEFASGNKFSTRSVTTRSPIFAVRLKANYPSGKPNRRTIRYLTAQLSAMTNDACFEIVHVHTPLTITATWADVDDSSSMEYSTNISALTATHMHVVDIINVYSGQAGKGESSVANSGFINQHAFISQNFESNNSQMFVVYATSRTGTADCAAQISWIESD